MATATESKIFYPGECEDASDVILEGATNPVGKGSSNTTAAKLLGTDTYGGSDCYWPFDVSVIPKNAIIDAVECRAKYAARMGIYTRGAIMLCSGRVPKGSGVMMTSKDATVYSLDTGTWTRAELDAIRLRTKAPGSYYGASEFYGADLTIEYTYLSEKFMLKLDGSYADAARVFKKVGSIWVEQTKQTELSGVIEDGVKYQNGGEYVTPILSFFIDGVRYYFKQGMTWTEWSFSYHNPGDVQEIDETSHVVDPTGFMLYYAATNELVYGADVILSGKGNYYWD